MKTQECIGVDLIGNQYVACIIKTDKTGPLYFSGRNNTEGGQLKFISKITMDREVLIPDSSLALRCLELFGDKRIHIASMGSLWSAWARAGVQRGKAMAKFAALYLIEEEFPSPKLTKAQIAKIQADHSLELEQIMRIGSDASRIGEAVLKGEATSKDFTLALKNEYQSSIKPSSVGPEEKSSSPLEMNDGSFLAFLAQALEELK